MRVNERVTQMRDKLKALLQENEQYAIELRRHFHMYPEASLQEEKTSKKICEELEKMGITYTVLPQRNVVAVINEGKPGKKIAIRADIDSLVMQEEVDVPWKSKIDGLMHACGHDAHTAALLGLAKSLNELKDELKGTVYLVFQVAEEIAEGAIECVEHLKSIGGVDTVIGTHIMGDMPKGMMGCMEGPMFSGIKTFKVVVKGNGGHGSRPDLTVEPIKPAADILLKISAIPAWRISPFDPFVVSPCKFNAGTAINIIPDFAEIEGNIRYYSFEAMEQAEKILTEVVENTAKAYGAEATIEFPGGNPPVINDAAAAKHVKEIAKELGYQVAPPSDPSAGSDNFSEFVKAFGGFYMVVGAKSERPGTSGNHHNVKFDIDESSIFSTMHIMGTYAIDYLNNH